MITGEADGKICLCDWAYPQRQEYTYRRLKRIAGASFETADTPLLVEAKRQLDEYFAGEREVFDLPLMLIGTEFQRHVWETLMEVPFGETVSYSRIAQRAGRPSATRAVANAIGANPMSIIIPCHRIIGESGKLTGYAGGLEAKRFLLNLEKK